MKKKLRNFTLLELLLVISIIAILTSLLLPALTNVRNKVKQAACSSNMKQIGLAAGMYTNDYNEWCLTGSYSGLVSGKNYWNSVIVRDLGYLTWKSAICPMNSLPLYGDYDSGYGLNVSTFGYGFMFGSTSTNTGIAKTSIISSFGTSSKLIMITENASGTYNGYHNYAGYGVSRYSASMGFYLPGDDSATSRNLTISLRHSNQANALIFDGHVETVTRTNAFDMKRWNPIQKLGTGTFVIQ